MLSKTVAVNDQTVREALAPIVNAGALAGAATIVWRRGRVCAAASVGRRNVQSGLPIERDTIFRIASLTKPVTTVAALMLLDEGRIALDDAIGRYAPELLAMRVLRHADGPLEVTDPARRAITFRDVLTPRSGLTYGDFHRGPIGEAYQETLGPQIDNDLTPNEWMARLATLPLVDEPGAGFHYGHSTDLLGFLIARIEGTPLSDVLARRIFKPLGMADTGFTVPPHKRVRRAAFCGFDTDGQLMALTRAPGGHALLERPDDMTFESGGQGLWSTVDDYLAFARIFVEGGAVDGVRLLQPETLRMMASNQLTATQRATAHTLGRRPFAVGHGYGMGVAVVMEPEHANPLRCGGGAGAVGWPGAYGGWWQADPNDGSVLVFLAHSMVELEQIARGIGAGVWSAIRAFHTVASA